MQRYFGKSVDGDTVLLHEDDVFHLTKVMRARVGQHLEVVIDETVFDVIIESIQPLLLKRNAPLETSTELPIDITLYYGIPKGDKLDLVLQKATELGVRKIVLLMSQRTVVKIDVKDYARKLERYQKIVKEASEQSKRLIIPEVMTIGDYSLIQKASGTIRFIADEEVAGTTSTLEKIIQTVKPDDSIDILIGPEGGFDRREVTFAQENGFIPISLGRRILRSETAVIYLLSVLSYSLERR